MDVGANDGDFARDLRDAGYAGRIISFEPASQTFRRLSAAAAGDALWDVLQLGVGDESGELKLSVSAIDVYSSFKKPSAIGNAAPGAREASSETVPVVRLDEWLRNNPIDLSKTYLKIDTQGFEVEVLRGCGDRLDQFAAVQAELGFIRLYEGQEDWLSIVQSMRERGFEVATMICNAVDPRLARAVEYDVVFTRPSMTGSEAS